MKIHAHSLDVEVEIIGEGSPILLVHGWGGSRASLQPLGTLLSKQGYKAILLDLPGFGQSDNPPPTWGTHEYAACVVEVMKALHISQYTYFGHSFGGSLGIYIAATHTNQIDRLILCNSSYKRSNKKSRLVVLKNISAPLARLFALGSLNRLKMLAYKVMYPQSDISRFPRLEQNFKRIMAVDLRPFLTDITVPTLILWGEDDRITSLEEYAMPLTKTIKGSKLVVYPGVGHALPVRHPELLVADIASFT